MGPDPDGVWLTAFDVGLMRLLDRQDVFRGTLYAIQCDAGYRKRRYRNAQCLF